MWTKVPSQLALGNAFLAPKCITLTAGPTGKHPDPERTWPRPPEFNVLMIHDDVMQVPETRLRGEQPHMHRTLEGLLQISNFVGSVMLIDDINDRIVRITSEMMRVPICSIYLLDENNRLLLRSNIGFEPELKGAAGFELDEGIPGWVASTGEILALSDALIDPRYAPLPSTLEQGCRAYLCAPLRIQEEIIGVMTARKLEVYHFTHDEIILFETICKQVAIVIEKARMYEQMIQAERLAAVAVSLSGVAHYIKNVLLTMQGGEYLVEQGIEHADLVRAGEGWNVLKRANKRIRKLVENILNYCRQTEPNRRAVNLNGLIADMLRTLEDTAHERGVELKASLDEEIGEIRVDPEIFYDALLNLVVNGIEAVAEGQRGQVLVRTSHLEGRSQVLVEVMDTGPGIPEEIRDRIFNLFFTTKGKKGTGIGLAAARKTVEAHGGHLKLAPFAEGQGAHFMIYLPLNPVESLVAPYGNNDD